MRINALVNSQLTKEIRIIPKHSIFRLKKNLYSVKSPTGDTMGQFGFQDNGLITDLKVSRKLRRKKDGLCALFAIKKFVTKKARKSNLDYITFYADEKNPNQVMKLYERFATLTDDTNPTFLLPVSAKGRKVVSKIMDMFPLSIF